ncbi:dihydroneopterin aldolase [Opitutales bacterium]|jgi:FolB domain-containing protein|nr:dihydroneopterin aldolase [Opitutales bacterium]
MGNIHLEGIEVMARIGLLEEELLAPQDLFVTVDLEYDFEMVRNTDELSHGIDYREVIAFVKKFATAYDGKMLERFAQVLAESLKDAFPVSKVSLCVDKPRYTGKLGLREIRVQVEL